ncbi:hypothetical protein CgunFtcFv8_012494 [Champsocephalus gunnari]|uniref:Ceroid-lipofuscinosis neuronal protein 6 n=1 Tax=Champsocephalus gunnari TaxID=52237 RepID=A0AAN8DS38_CHAGU|nr:hypothetical protein CgunFtcFv8_012494 [Champsocephalus gunnari]
MQSFPRKRKNPALLAATLSGSRGSGSEEVLPGPRFQLDLWLGFILHSWILDVGRPFVTLVLPADLFPLNRPSAAEYLHFLFNICTPLILLKMIERTPRSLPPLAVHLGVIAVATGTSLHLVTDAITRRLVLIGYQLHLSVRDNPIMEELRPPALIDAFELLCFFDDTIGHLMWCVPFFLALFLFFSGCFHHRTQEDKMPPTAWMLLLPSATYYWFLMAEGQTFILFIFTFFAMTATVMHQRRRGLVPDANGLFMLYSFSAALLLLLLWVSCLWSDGVLRRKHRGLIYIPQPRAVYTLHTHT